MRFSENRSDEINALVKLMQHKLRKGGITLNGYKWFYDQIEDLVERELASDSSDYGNQK